jgi:hypothetical protein
VDYKIHTHASYAVCDAADLFRMGPYGRRFSRARQLMEAAIPDFFKQSAAERDWSRCQAPLLQAGPCARARALQAHVLHACATCAADRSHIVMHENLSTRDAVPRVTALHHNALAVPAWPCLHCWAAFGFRV